MHLIVHDGIATGTFLREIFTDGEPIGVCIDKTGNVLISGLFRKKCQVRVFQPNGDPVTEFPLTHTYCGLLAWSLAIDDSNRIFVDTGDLATVRVFGFV